jgi:Zn-dependent protease with chaperone function
MTTTILSEPAPLLAQLPRPSAAYKRMAWLAGAGLVLFLALYFLLAGWFLWTAYRLTLRADDATFTGYAVGICALFLAVFMLKPMFFVRRGSVEGTVEINQAQQPRRFAFLYQIADGAAAPRPHRVLLSSRVNASVFSDLSLLNLIFPSRKNLEIGLALVNALTLGEFRAVLAHEFGHFTQRSMAVTRWAYAAQQIAAHLVARRDKLDAMLRTLCRIDIRVAWVGWLLSLIVWSIRSLVESAFGAVVVLERALSRDMEMQADLVAVALTGSDALIHALHRLEAADDSWDRTVAFLGAEHASARVARDVFTLHSRMIAARPESSAATSLGG